MRIIPIASGKGGVGKTILAANLSIALSQAGKKVVVADLDLGGSDLHLVLGLVGIRKGIGTFLTNNSLKFEEIIVETEYENLKFIPGDAEIPGTANLKSSQKRMIIRKLHSLEADYLIMDLGAGTNFNVIDFFLTSRRGIIITTPTPTARLNAYLFLKNTVFRIMSSSFKKNSKAREYMGGMLQGGSSPQKIYVPYLLKTIREKDPDSYSRFREKLGNFSPRIILNLLEDPSEVKRAEKLRRSCREYLDLDIEHLGIIYRDDLQDIALQSRLPIIRYKPNSVLSQAVYRITDKLIQEEAETEEEAPLDFESLDETYQTAEMEAELDFETKMRYMEDLLHCGALTMGDLVETIKSQQYEINQLKKENYFIKAKLVKAIQAGFIDR
ncbi:MAG: MinD/ParA family protein [Spirochaetes bacterium]|nr:MAG: MinD/ParA family protein [Spirochaetota bacterium]